MLSAAFRGSPPPQMQHRGRSRIVSPVALARQASEERRLSLNPPITDTFSSRPQLATSIPRPSESTSPPADTEFPPLSLEDQVQVAYAHDNIRLAKILLLRLKGIHVADDSDPRIDSVRDEDFDALFAPSGPLTLDEADKRAVQETQRRQRQWWHESQRAQRLRACERLWEDEKHRLHSEKLRALQRREHVPEPQRTRMPEKHPIKSRPETLPSTKRDQDPFQYSFMPPSRPSTLSIPCRPVRKPLTHVSGSINRPVPFKEVINAMNGKLFPLDASERADDARRITGLPIANSSSQRRKASVRAELLDNLLQVVEWQEGERRKAKGKEVVRDQQPSKSSVHAPTPVPSVPSSLSVASVSSSSPSRSSSWLSFGSWRSTATDITTPDSPVLPSPTLSHPCLPTVIESQRELHPRCAFVRVSIEESPLCPPIISHHMPLVHGNVTSPSATEFSPSLSMPGTLVNRVTRSVATIVGAAKSLQSAYIAATMFTAGSPYRDCAASQPRRSSRCQRQLRRDGYRAIAKDVQRFTDSTPPIDQDSGPVHFIPLASLSSGTAGLPNKPPVPKNVLVFPSPLRPRTPPAALAYRMRPVANPAVLRLRALQNVMCARGKEWEGRAREGGLGCGKERMLGIAFEGRGRSGLGCEVRFIVA